MPGGQYTNIIDGSKVDVAQDGSATISINNPEGIFAICVGCDGTGPGPTPGPTSNPTEPHPTNPQPTDPPIPGEKKRTVIFLEKQTVSGQDVFIRGGLSPNQGVGHTVRKLDSKWWAYNDWAEGDTMLDWNGAEGGQGKHDGRDALGTPTGWTSNWEGNQFHHPFNVWGDHYWIADLDMDCSDTKDGWFEVQGLFSGGGEGGEGQDVHQEGCTGAVGGQVPFQTNHHAGRCGFLNVFHYDNSQCQIENIPSI